MARRFPRIPFERYCDDVVVHCTSERQARHIRDAIAQRLADCGLELNEAKAPKTVANFKKLAQTGFYAPDGAYGLITLIVFAAWVLVTSGLLVSMIEKVPAARAVPAA